MTILIVEDNALIAMTLEAALAGAGYRVLGPVSTAAGAIRIAERTPPRIALINMQLLDGTSGVALARNLKERWGTTVVFVTGERLDGERHREVAIGFLAKPCSEEALLATVQVAERVIAGESLDAGQLPKGLEIF